MKRKILFVLMLICSVMMWSKELYSHNINNYTLIRVKEINNSDFQYYIEIVHYVTSDEFDIYVIFGNDETKIIEKTQYLQKKIRYSSSKIENTLNNDKDLKYEFSENKFVDNAIEHHYCYTLVK